MLTFLNPFALYRAYCNYDSEFCSHMFQRERDAYFSQSYYYLKVGYFPYNYLDVVKLFSQPYFNDENKGLLRILIDASNHAGLSTRTRLSNISYFFDRIPNSVNHNLLKTLIKKNIIRNANDIDHIERLFDTQEKVDRFNSINLALLQTLIDKGIIENADDMNTLFDAQEKVDRLNSVNLNLLDKFIQKGIIRGCSDINSLFDTQEKVDRFYKSDVFQTLLDNRIIRNANNINELFGTQEKFDRLNSVSLDVLHMLTEVRTEITGRICVPAKAMLKNANDVSSLFSTQEKVDRLNSINPYSLHMLIKRGVVNDHEDIDNLINKQEMIDFLNQITEKRMIKNIHDENAFYEMLRRPHRVIGASSFLCQFIKNNIITSIGEICELFENSHRYHWFFQLERVNRDLLNKLIERKAISSIFSRSCSLFNTSESIDIFNSINPDVLSELTRQVFCSPICEIELLCNTQQRVDRLNSINLDSLKILIKKGFLSGDSDSGKLLDNEDFITNAVNPSYLTKTILDNYSLRKALGAKGIVDLISHPKYTESSNYLLRNCKLALALLGKGAIYNITVDYLFDSLRIQEDVKNNEFLKDIQLTDVNDSTTVTMNDVIDGIFIENQNDITYAPMPKLKDLSLEAFVKTMPKSPEL